MNSVHRPVLLQEVMSVLDPQPGEFFIDGTFGGGGHACALLEKLGSAGRLMALDWNEAAVVRCRDLHDERLTCVRGNFSGLPEMVQKGGPTLADALLLDLGVSSDELEQAGRGFSFQNDEPLLMTYSDEQTPVRELLARASEAEITAIILTYSQERWAPRISRAIVHGRRRQPIVTSRQLADIIAAAVPAGYERGRLHPATRTFLALRIYANRELDNLETVLQNLPQIVAPGGRVAVISFNSLEDRLVKNYFKRWRLITRKPLRPTSGEVMDNPRARSAKLRAITIGNSH